MSTRTGRNNSLRSVIEVRMRGRRWPVRCAGAGSAAAYCSVSTRWRISAMTRADLARALPPDDQPAACAQGDGHDDSGRGQRTRTERRALRVWQRHGVALRDIARAGPSGLECTHQVARREIALRRVLLKGGLDDGRQRGWDLGPDSRATDEAPDRQSLSSAPVRGCRQTAAGQTAARTGRRPATRRPPARRPVRRRNARAPCRRACRRSCPSW